MSDDAVPDYRARLDLSGRGYVVFGAGRGIGRQSAHALRQAGANVVCVDNDESRAHAVAAEVGGLALVADVSVAGEIDRAVAAAAAHLGRLDGIVDIIGGSRGGWRHFGHVPAEGETDADMGRRHAEVFLQLLKGEGFAKPNPRPMFPNPPGLLRLEPHSEGLRERIWWGSASNATAVWAAQQGMNLQSSTLKADESGEPFHVQQAKQIRLYRQAWQEAGHARTPRVSVSRSIFALTNDEDRAYFGRGDASDQVGVIDNMRAVFGRSYADEPDRLVEALRADEAIAEADTLLLTVPNQLGVDYNAHVIDAILRHVAPALGWR